MKAITTQWIIDTLNSIELQKLDLEIQLKTKELELKNIPLVSEISELKKKLTELETQDSEIREQGKQVMINSWIKKFEALDWTVIQLNKTPWSIVIENENLVPKEYFKEKTTITLDKKQLKEDISQGLIIDWVSISEDYKLVIKNK